MARAGMEGKTLQTVDGSAVVVHTEGSVVVNVPMVQSGAEGIFILSKPLDFETGKGESNRVKHISGLRLDFETDADETIPANMVVKLGWQLRMSDDITWTDEKQITALNQLFPFNISGRYIHIELRDRAPELIWKLTKIEFLGRVMGKGLG